MGWVQICMNESWTACEWRVIARANAKKNRTYVRIIPVQWRNKTVPYALREKKMLVSARIILNLIIWIRPRSRPTLPLVWIRTHASFCIQNAGTWWSSIQQVKSKGVSLLSQFSTQVRSGDGLPSQTVWQRGRERWSHLWNASDENTGPSS